MIYLIGAAADAILVVWGFATLLNLFQPDSRATAYWLRRGLWPYVVPLAVLLLVTALARRAVDALTVLCVVAVAVGWAMDWRWYTSDHNLDDQEDDEDPDDQDDDPGDDEDDPDDDDDDGDGETWTDRARRIVENLTGTGPRLKVVPAGA